VNNSNSKITILYSGGLDTTTLAYLLLKETDVQLHLLTFLHGYGQLFKNFTRLHVKQLKDKFGEHRIVHKYFSIKKIFKKICINDFVKDIYKYKNLFVWCLGCHLSMMTEVIIYNLENDIKKAMIGKWVFEDKPVMCMDETIKEEKLIYKEYGIIFNTPLVNWKMDKRKGKIILKKAGIWPGIIFRESSLGVQPICIPGNIQHFKDTFFGIHPTYNPDMVKKYIKEKKTIIKNYISQELFNARYG